MNWVVSMSLDAAIGLGALHEAADAPIVHFDVKLSQLLIQDNGRVRLADYNLAYFMGTSSDGSPCHFNKKSATRNGNWRKSPEFASGKVRKKPSEVATADNAILLQPVHVLPVLTLLSHGAA